MENGKSNTAGFNDRVLLIDKPVGVTSFKALDEIRRITGVKKIGHSGTLDSFASGLLVVCTGRATRFTRYFLDHDKAYSGKVRLGVITDTCDPSGDVIGGRPPVDLNEESLNAVRTRFVGELSQKPPLYSALKVKGQRASDLTRRGVEVDLQERKVNIRHLDIAWDENDPALLRLEVVCSKGTYIRSLARDIGDFLGCGAYLEALRRTVSGGFLVSEAVSPGELVQFREGRNPGKKFLLRPEEALEDMGKVFIGDDAVKRVLNGVSLKREDVKDIQFVEGKPYLVMDSRRNLLAIAEIDMEPWRVKYLNVIN